MTVPLVAAVSASCSTNGTGAPRPATRDGSMAARVAGGAGTEWGLTPAKAVPPRLTMAAVAVATPATIQRDRLRLAALRMMIPDIKRLVSLRDGQRLPRLV